MNTERIILRSCLLNLLEGKNVEENISICLKNMEIIYGLVDDIRLQQKRSSGSHWTERALDQTDLKKLGNFTVDVKTSRKKRNISFTSEEKRTVCFIFSLDPRNLIERLPDVVERSKGQSSDQQKDLAEAFLKSVVMASVGGKNISPEEVILGSKPSTLLDYKLKSVEVLEAPSGLFRTRKKKVLQ